MEGCTTWYEGELQGFVAPVAWDQDSWPVVVAIETDDELVKVHATRPEIDLTRCLRAEVRVRGLIREGADGSRAIYVHRCKLVFD